MKSLSQASYTLLVWHEKERLLRWRHLLADGKALRPEKAGARVVAGLLGADAKHRGTLEPERFRLAQLGRVGKENDQ